MGTQRDTDTTAATAKAAEAAAAEAAALAAQHTTIICPVKSQQRQTTTTHGEPLEKPEVLARNKAAAAAAAATTVDLDDSATRGELNLDSGYAWLILVIMFLICSSTGGSTRVYGLVYAKQVAIGYYDREDASWPLSAASALENLAGILTPALARYLSWRQIQLLSASLFVLANLGAYLSNSLATDIICLGVLQGLALSISTLLTLLVINDYFERYRTTAYGLALSGSTCGVFYLGPAAAYLLDNYDNFRLVYLALSGLFATNLALAAFVVPRSTGGGGADGCGQEGIPTRESFAQRAHSALTRKVSLFESHFERENSIASITLECRARRLSAWSRSSVRSGSCRVAEPLGRSTICRAQQQQQQQQQQQSPQQPWKRQIVAKSISVAEMGVGPPIQPASQHQQKTSVYSIGADSIGSKGGIVISAELDNNNKEHTQATQRTMTLAAKRGAAATAGKGTRVPSFRKAEFQLEFSDSESVASAVLCGPTAAELVLDERRQLAAKLKQAECEKQQQQQPATADAGNSASGGPFSLAPIIELLKSPYTHCAWIMLALYYLVARILVTVLADFGADRGLSESEANGLLNYWSLGELTGRLLLAALIDLRWLDVRNCIVLTCGSLAASLVLLVSGQSYLVYAFATTSVSALASLECVLINALMVEYLGKDSVMGCYSTAAFVSSVLLFGRPAMVGWSRDRLGAYDALLLVLAGASLIFALLFGLLEPLLVRRWPKRTTTTTTNG